MGQGAVAPPPSGPMGLPYTRAMPSCTSLLRPAARICATGPIHGLRRLLTSALLLLCLLPLQLVAQDAELERASEMLGPAPHKALDIARQVRGKAAAQGDAARVAQARIVAARALSALAAGDEAETEISEAVAWLERNGGGAPLAQARKWMATSSSPTMITRRR